MVSNEVKLAVIGGTSWKKVLEDFRSYSAEQVRNMSVNDRISVSSAMFSEFRNCIVNSLPEDLSEKEFKKEVYFRTYGEPLPDDFFKD